MNLPLFAALAGLALLDSINPSAIAAAVVLMTQPRFGPRLLAYVGGVFVTYLAAGFAILIGLDIAWGLLASPVGYAAQGLLGAGLLIYAWTAPDKPPADDGARRFGSGLPLAAVAALGAGMTLAEFATALPYVAGLALLADVDLPWAAKALVLVAYNLVFIAPPLLLGGAYLALGERVRPRFERFGEKLRNGARITMLWLMGIAGFLLLRNALVFFGSGDFDLQGLLRGE